MQTIGAVVFSLDEIKVSYLSLVNLVEIQIRYNIAEFTFLLSYGPLGNIPQFLPKNSWLLGIKPITYYIITIIRENYE